MAMRESFISLDKAKPNRTICAMGNPKSMRSVLRSRKTCRNSFRIKVSSWIILVCFTLSVACQLIENVFHGGKSVLLFQPGGAVEGCDDSFHHDLDSVPLFPSVPIMSRPQQGYALC